MFLAYCLTPDHRHWTPPVHLATAKEAYGYCALHHGWVPEIRVTDTDDFVVMHMVDHVLKIPMPDGTFREMPITAELVAAIKAAP